MRWLPPDVAVDDDAAVQPFGPFLLLDALASGGMGEVWLAAPPAPDGADDVCVLKRVRAELAENDVAVRRFIDEARLGLLLRHPCIGRTIDAGRAAGCDYLAAELVEGIDLGRLSLRVANAGQRLAPPVAMWCIASALDGLAWAHAARHPLTDMPLGVVHRDVSPNNLMASRDGLVRVIDFGLALSSVREARTELGLVLGKPGYMSPEHARGDPVGPGGDVYAAGIVLYELLTGERYYGLVPRDRQRLIAAGGVWRAAMTADVDAATGGLFSAMVAPEPAARPTAAQARDALLALIGERGGVDAATHQLGALVTAMAAPELARFDEARARARALVRPPVDDDATTLSLAASESQAVQALLKTPPPPVAKAVTLAPGQMWQASPSLVALASVLRPDDDVAGEGKTVRMRPADVAREAETVDMRLRDTRPDTPLRDVGEAPPVPAAASPPDSAGAPTGPTGATPRTTLALPASSPSQAVPRPVVAVAVLVALGAGIGIGSLASRPSASPAPAVVSTPTTTAPAPAPSSPWPSSSPAPPAPPAPPPITPEAPAPVPTARTKPTPPPPPVADSLLARLKRLATCSHPCGRLFVGLARDGVGSLTPDRRAALEALVTSCEANCR
jgi:serine/threonine-protein kinase